MTKERLKEVLGFYLNRWSSHYPPRRMDTEAFFGNRETVMSHVMWMCQEAIKEAELDYGKAERWLGFIQGVLFSVGHYTIDEMRAHTMSPKDP